MIMFFSLAWIVGIIAILLVIFGFLLQRHDDQVFAAEQAEEEKRATECLEALDEIFVDLSALTYKLCGTDQLSEEIRREEMGDEYRLPVPLVPDLYVEVMTLQKALAQYEVDLQEYRNSYIDARFYRGWVTSLQDRFVVWQVRRQAIEECNHLRQRLTQLLQVLRRVHGVRGVTQDEPSFESYQGLYNATSALRQQIQEQKRALQNGGIEAQVGTLASQVEALEDAHRALDGNCDLFNAETLESVKQEVLDRWRTVVSCTSETRPALLTEFLQESNAKYRAGYMAARHCLLECGACGQPKALEHFKTALIHWSCSQALVLVLRVHMHEDLSDPSTIDAYAHPFSRALVRKCHEDLQMLQASMYAFDARFGSSLIAA